MKYAKPKLLAKSQPTQKFAMGCPEKSACSFSCKDKH
jgi:hypothetical protein